MDQTLLLILSSLSFIPLSSFYSSPFTLVLGYYWELEKSVCGTLRVATKGYRGGGGVVEGEESQQTETERLLPAKHRLGWCPGTV